MNRAETLLRRVIGLDAASVGCALIERTFRLRMKALGITAVERYVEHVLATPAEWEELLESVVVTETWFFRDHTPFAAFARLARSELGSSRTAPLRILSAPCASGEEPYSLAMALLDEGIAPERFEIHAVDISARSLARAQAGRYRKNSFRGKDLLFRDRHFTADAEGFILKPEVRACVRFHRGNLLSPDFLTGWSGFDFIFCRNLLIYFDRATQVRALKRLHGLLAAEGAMFVGSAELPLVSGHGFVPLPLPMAFACRKATLEDEAAPSPRPVPRPAHQASLPKAPFKLAPQTVKKVPHESAPEATAEAQLQQARALADAGKLAAAASLCEGCIKQFGPSAAAYYLLGLVRDAAGETVAMDYYRKALYLQPDHYETLLQMALWLERAGDASGAQTLRRRAERCGVTP